MKFSFAYHWAAWDILLEYLKHMHQKQIQIITYAQLQATLASTPSVQSTETYSQHVICLKNYSCYLTFSRTESPWVVFTSNAFRPMSSSSHLNKTSCCIRISGSQHFNKQHPMKKKELKKITTNLQSLQRHIWERYGKYSTLMWLKTELRKLNAWLTTEDQTLGLVQAQWLQGGFAWS